MKKKKLKIYSNDFKWKVVQEILEGKFSKEEARKVYGIRSNCAILYWMRKFSSNSDYRDGGVPLGTTVEMGISKELTEKDQRIRELEEELVREKLRADLWQRMVEIAEAQLKIDIRKKYGAKQSIPSKVKKGAQQA
jgi:transposase-like protein